MNKESTSQSINTSKASVKKSNLKLFDQAEEIAKIGSWEYVIKTNKIFWSDGVFKILETEKDKVELDYDTAISFIHPDDLEITREYFKKIINNGVESSWQFRFVSVKGNIKYIKSKTIVEKDRQKRLTRIYGIFQDITELIENNNFLSNSDFKLKFLEKHINDIIWEADFGNNYINYISSPIESFLGFKPSECIKSKKWLSQIINKEDFAHLKEIIHDLNKENDEKIIEHRILTKDGKTKWVKNKLLIYYDDDNNKKVRGIVHDITDNVESLNNFKLLLNNTKEIFFQVNTKLEIINFNQEFFNTYKSGYGIEIQVGDNLIDYISLERKDLIKNIFKKVFKERKEIEVSVLLDFQDVEKKEFKVIYKPAINNFGEIFGAFISMIDITKDAKQKKFDKLEKELMAASIRTDADFKLILNNYLIGLEELFEGMHTSILEINNNKIYTLVSPSLPVGYAENLNGQKIGPKAGSCGTAAYLKKTIIVDNIATDPLWKNYKQFALKYGLKSCWSQPIFNSKNEVIATFANYYDYVNKPNKEELDFFNRTSYLISIIFENYLKSREIKESNERYKYISKATEDAIYDWDVKKDTFEWADGFKKILGLDFENEVFSINDWVSLMHPEDAMSKKQEWEDFLIDEKQTIWKSKFRFKKADGKYIEVEEIGNMLRDYDGSPKRMIGVIRDISNDVRAEEVKNFIFKIDDLFKKEDVLDKILKDVLDLVAKKSQAKIAEIWLISATDDIIKLHANCFSEKKYQTFYEKSKRITSFKKGEGLPGSVWTKNQIEEWKNINTRTDFLRNEAALVANLRSAVGLPLFYQGDIIGVLLLGTDNNSFDIKDYPEIIKLTENSLGAEIRRKQQEEELSIFFEQAPDIMAVAGTNGRFLKVNLAFAELLGYTKEEITNKKFIDFIHPDDISNTTQEYEITIKGIRKAKNYINRYKTKAGNYKWISWSSSTVFGGDGLAFAYGRDITEIKELQDLLDNASKLAKIGGWEYTVETENSYWSAITKSIHEVEQDFEPAPNKSLEFFRKDYRDKILKAFQEALNDGKDYDLECPIITAKGNEKWIRVIGKSIFKEGKCIKVFGSFQDINKRKINEIELAKKNQYLEAISQITRLFVKSTDWKEALNKAFQIGGKTVDIDRLYFFQNGINENEELVSSQVIEWVKKDNLSEMNNPLLQNIPISNFKVFFDFIKSGNHFAEIVSEMEDSPLKNGFEIQNIKSILIVPVITNNSFYGFIGFDDCIKERIWSDGEISFLKTISSNLSSSIEKAEFLEKIQSTFNEKNNILESIGDAFFAVDNNWVVTYWNKEAEKVLGKNREDILNKNLWDEYSDAVNLKFYTEYHKAVKTKQKVQFEEYYPTADKWLEVSAYPSVSGLSIYFKDITEKKKADEELLQAYQRFVSITEATNDAVWDWDFETNNVLLSSSFQKLFGHEIDKINSSVNYLNNLIHPDDSLRVLKSLDEIVNKDTDKLYNEEYRLKKADGKYAYVIERGKIIKNKEGKPIRMVGALSDITHRKEYEESLKKLNFQLEKRAKELATSNAELEQFAFVASHDLQEPLRMVTSFLTLLEKKYADVIDEKGKKYIHFAVDGSQRMRQIILDLLEYSRVGHFKDNMENVDTKKLVYDVLLLYRKKIEEKKAVIRFNDLPVIKTFETPLRQAFHNLISNALKYSKKDVRPVIEINCTDKKSVWEFSVADNGIGIRKEYHDKIFLILKRLHSKEEFEGSGIGLSVTKKIIENLGGKIWLTSNENKGSTFYFSIPKKKLNSLK